MGWLAKDIMTTDVLCVFAEMDLRDLTKLLLERGISGVPVTRLDGSLLGVVSQTDLLRYTVSRDEELAVESDFYGTARIEGRHLPRGFQIADVNTGTAADVMTPVIHAVKETTPVEEVARLMRRRHIHRAIVERGGKVVGIISALDLLAVLTTPPRPKPAKKK